MEQIRHIVEHMPIEEAVKRDILAVYDILAAGESKAHGKPVEEVHFHEVGAKDAIADITAVCLLMRRIGAEKIRASAVHVGSGKVRCAHGIMPVPAPATAAILENIPIYSTGLEGELCTPTGAALLKYYVQDFGPMPAMAVQKTGYGMGKKDFPVANCVRALLGESTDTEKFAAEGAQTYAVPEGSKAFSQGGKEEHIIGLSCNVDDMTGEEMGYAIEELLAAGAREAYVIPVTMKKSRPGMQLEVYCTEGDRQRMVEKIFALTTTIGIRELVYNRYILDRTEYTQSTTLGEVRVKKSSGYGVVREKAEYEDVKRIAKEQGSSIARVREMIGKEISGDS